MIKLRFYTALPDAITRAQRSQARKQSERNRNPPTDLPSQPRLPKPALASPRQPRPSKRQAVLPALPPLPDKLPPGAIIVTNWLAAARAGYTVTPIAPR